MIPEHNTIYNADMFCKTKEFDDKSFDVTFTSPPYNRKRNDKYSLYNDNINDYYEFLVSFTDECLRVTKRHVLVNIQKNYYNKVDVFKYIGHYSELLQEVLIWNKPNPMPRGGNCVINGYEFVFVLGDTPLTTNSTYIKNICTIPVNHTNDDCDTHKAIMSKEFCDWIVTNFTKNGDFILDPFFGYGTTGISCMENNRFYCGIEIVKQYYEKALSNLRKPVQKHLF